MALGQIEPYLFPAAAEGDPAFRAEMLRLSQKGVLLLGWFEIAAAVFMLVTQLMAAANRAVISGRIWQAFLVSSAGAPRSPRVPFR